MYRVTFKDGFSICTLAHICHSLRGLSDSVCRCCCCREDILSSLVSVVLFEDFNLKTAICSHSLNTNACCNETLLKIKLLNTFNKWHFKLHCGLASICLVKS